MQGGEPVTSTEIGPKSGERVQLRRQVSACEVVVFEGVPLTHCIADPAKHVISAVLADPQGTPYRSLNTYGAALGRQASVFAFVTNGWMLDAEGQPIGYYVERGERLKELNREEGSGNFYLRPSGVFYGTAGKWETRTAEDFYSNVGDRPQFGTQSGPMLVIGGQLHPEVQDDGQSRAIRNGLGGDAEGKAHFVISEAPISFGQLARYFRNELKTPNALYLDGSVSALWDPVTERLDEGPSIGPLLLVTKKE